MGNRRGDLRRASRTPERAASPAARFDSLVSPIVLEDEQRGGRRGGGPRRAAGTRRRRAAGLRAGGRGVFGRPEEPGVRLVDEGGLPRHHVATALRGDEEAAVRELPPDARRMLDRNARVAVAA